MREIPLSQAEEDAAREEALAIADQLAANETEDFDAFWAAQDRNPVRLKNVFGVDVELPPALPLRFEVESRKAATSTSDEDTKRMVGLLFGQDALDRWTEAGMDVEQFAVLLMWGTANTRAPNSMTLAEAHQIYRDRISGELGKALTGSNASTTASGVKSPVTGRPSKRTSAASTSSRKRK